MKTDKSPKSDAPAGDVSTETAPPEAPQIPMRENNELLSSTEAAASTITGCTDAQIKNFMATADYAQRQLAVQLADLWKGICKTADKVGAENEKAKKVAIGVKIDIDHTNLLLHDTKVTTSYSEKHVVSDEIQEDLSQTEFALQK